MELGGDTSLQTAQTLLEVEPLARVEVVVMAMEREGCVAMVTDELFNRLSVWGL
jgi:hypothetical protein